MKYGEIRDPIHGNIDLDENETRIVNTPEMQRLRHIRQLDMAYLIFPGANHTRFEHSLGTMHITRELERNIFGGTMREFVYVGLLHDIGHGPFSHLSEKATRKYLKTNHEKMGEGILRGSEIRDIINDSGLSFDRVLSYFRESDKIDLVGGALGSDRIDYLMRDSHYTGVAYGIIDYERIKGRLAVFGDRIAVTEQGIAGAESMLIARYFMHSNVYQHHAKIIAASMLQNALDFLLEAGELDPKEMAGMYDEQLLNNMLHSGVAHTVEIARRINERRLFKRAFYENVEKDVDVEGLALALEKAGVGRNEFIINMGSIAGGMDDIDVIDSDGNSVGRLADLSPLISTLKNILASSRKLLVACDRKDVDRVNAIVRKFVG